jgi:hypothetical protein
VNEFVDECRREWRRLRVPDPVANEMAADLEADLQEAEAEGATAEDVLGAAAFDPRPFAASWAAERGVIPPPLATPARRFSPTLARRPRLLVLAAALALFVVGVGLVAGVSSTGVAGSRSAAAAPISGPPVGPPGVPFVPFPVPLPRGGPGMIFAVSGPGAPGLVLRALGTVIVIAGIGAVALVLLVWARSLRARGSSGDGG